MDDTLIGEAVVKLPDVLHTFVDDHGLLFCTKSDIHAYAHGQRQPVGRFSDYRPRVVPCGFHADADAVYVAYPHRVLVYDRTAMHYLRDVCKITDLTADANRQYCGLTGDRVSRRLFVASRVLTSGTLCVEVWEHDGPLERVVHLAVSILNGAHTHMCADAASRSIYLWDGRGRVCVLCITTCAVKACIDVHDAFTPPMGAATLCVVGKALLVAPVGGQKIIAFDTATRVRTAECALDQTNRVAANLAAHGDYAYAVDTEHDVVKAYLSPMKSLTKHLTANPGVLYALSNGVSNSPVVAIVIQYVCAW